MMDAKLKQDLSWFFTVYRDRTADLVKSLPAPMQKEFDEEIDLLRTSILSRLAQDLGQ